MKKNFVKSGLLNLQIQALRGLYNSTLIIV